MVFGFGWTSPKEYPLSEVPRLTGLVVVVTGANGELGKALSWQLSRCGAKVYLGCRSRPKAEAVQRELTAALDDTAIGNNKDNEKKIPSSPRCFPGGSLNLLPSTDLDLSNLKSVEAWCRELANVEDHIDLVLCAAGIIPTSFTKAAGTDMELTWATNHLGHLVLIQGLLDLLQRPRPTGAAEETSNNFSSQEARITVVASDVTRYSLGYLPWFLRPTRSWFLDEDAINDAKKWARMAAYSRSKIANVVLTKQLAKRLPLDQSTVSIPASATSSTSVLSSAEAQVSEPPVSKSTRPIRINSLHPGAFASSLLLLPSPPTPPTSAPTATTAATATRDNTSNSTSSSTSAPAPDPIPLPTPSRVQRLVRSLADWTARYFAMDAEKATLTPLYVSLFQQKPQQETQRPKETKGNKEEESSSSSPAESHGDFFTPYTFNATSNLCALAKDESVGAELWDKSVEQVRRALGEDWATERGW